LELEINKVNLNVGGARIKFRPSDSQREIEVSFDELFTAMKLLGEGK